MPPVSLQKATRVLESYVAGAGEPELWKLWIALPDGLDDALLARAFARAVRVPHSARVVGRALNSAYLELFLAELAKHPRWPETLAASCLDADSPKLRAQQLGELFRKLGQLGIFSLSASQRDERIRAFAQDPRFVEAARRIVVREREWLGPRVGLWSLAGVLMEDGSAESVDALLPLLERAVKAGSEELDRLRRMLKRRTSPGPALEPMRRLLESRAGARRGPAQLQPLVAAIGLQPVPPTLALSWSASARKARRWHLDVSLRVDLDAEPFFRLTVVETRFPAAAARSRRKGAQRARSSFTSRGTLVNELGLPPLKDLLGWPRWLARLQRERAPWEQVRLQRCNLRGSNRVRLARWLEGTSVARNQRQRNEWDETRT